ncbi:MAG: hypothetical protein IPG50_38985 [Myxococcales bacterium]|nr:hypothetical protein [Myxococcales bacterium]
MNARLGPALVALLSLVVPVACGAVSDGTLPNTSTADGGAADGAAGASLAKSTDVAKGADASAKADAAASCATAKEGQACGSEGQMCTPSPCNDPCQFCNILSCQSGTWQRMEAFPLPQTECAPSFACGSFTCKRGEFCVARHSGPMPLEGGSGVSYECVDLQTTCGGGCACALSAAKLLNLACTPTTCDAPAGGPVVQCYGI